MGEENQQGRAASARSVVEYIWAHTRYLKAQTDELTRWQALTPEQQQEALSIMRKDERINGSVEQ